MGKKKNGTSASSSRIVRLKYINGSWVKPLEKEKGKHNIGVIGVAYTKALSLIQNKELRMQSIKNL